MKKKQNKILVFGYFGYVTNQLDGQTVKTRSVYELLKDDKNLKVKFADSQSFRNKPISILKCLKDIICSDVIVWLPAHNNLKYLLPLIWPIAFLSRTRIIYSVIGGWLLSFIKKLPVHRWMLGRIHRIFAETSTVKNGLESEYGFNNVELLYNFRNLDRVSPNKDNVDLRLVFCARINRKKGLETIFNYLDSLPQESRITVDFYGPIATEDEAWFTDNINNHKSARYMGILQPKDIQSTLNAYDVMVFPTQYYTEGLPGTVIDSYFASIPVIATEWLNAREFIKDGKTGIIIPFENSQLAFNTAVNKLDTDRNLLMQMKVGAGIESAFYTAQMARKKILDTL